MKSFNIYVFLSVIFILVGFHSVSSTEAAVKECPLGYTYNASTNKCEAEPSVL